jgi:hypothetical protein
MFLKIQFVVILFISNLLIIIPNKLIAATLIASSCFQSDVQSAINAANDGDTVFVPPGTCTWTSGISATKGITLAGAGIDKTIIKSGLTNGTLLVLTVTSGSANLRITGFTFDAATGSDTWGLVMVNGIYTAPKWRVDNCKFTNLYKRGMTAKGYGIIDHCTFELKGNRSVQGIAIWHDGATSWTRSYTPGTSNAVYIEDCVFNFDYVGDGAFDAYQGARLVFRYNQVNGTVIGWHGYDSDTEGTHSFEVYNNTFNSSGRAIHVRGGTGVVFNNTFTSSGSIIQLNYYRSCYNPNYPEGGWGSNIGPRCDGIESMHGNEAEINGDGFHTGSNGESTLTDANKNWAVNQWVNIYIWNITDGSKCKITENTSTTVVCSLSGGTQNKWNTNDSYKITNGWPCKRQPGMTTGDTKEPIYEWNNERTSGIPNVDWDVYDGWGASCAASGPATIDHIKVNRDFYNDTQKPGYNPFTYPHPLTQFLDPPKGLRILRE